MGLFAFVLAPAELVLAQSVGALVDIRATLAMFLWFRAASRLHPVGLLRTLYVNSSDVLGFIGKDATLTGEY
jgi:hypothetical protein